MFHSSLGAIQSDFHGITFGRLSEIDACMTEEVFSFREANHLKCLPRRDDNLKSSWVCIADVLARHPYNTAGDVQRVATAVEHAPGMGEGAVERSRFFGLGLGRGVAARLRVGWRGHLESHAG